MAKIVLTGGSGTLGRALIPKLRPLGSLTVISRSEARQLDLRAKYPDVEFLLGDVTGRGFLWRACEEATVIIHAAALKHVPLSEREPMAYTKVNVCGTIEVVEVARMLGARVIAISTDKACCPQNVYGLTKLLMERMVVEAGGVAVRYGNVFGSAGSVMTRWRAQLAENDMIQVTDPEMTRFFFPLARAVRAVLWSLKHAPPASVVIPLMPATSLGNMARAFLEDTDGGGTIRIGRRPGEKLHETILSTEEGHYAWREGSYVILRRDKTATRPLSAITSDTAEQIPPEELAQWIRDY